MQNSKQRYNAPKADEPPLIYGKIPPQASDLEQAVLGACMLEVMAFDKISGILTPECFYKDAHVKIFSSMRSLADKSQPIDLLTVFAELQKSGELEAVGGASYITTLTNIVASTAHLEDHARIVLEKHIKREQIRVGSSMIVDGYDDTKDALEALDEAEEKLFSISGFTLKKDFEHISRGLFENMKKIEALRNREYSLTGVPTGFKRLDRITNGWQNTDLVIIAARPSVGKSALALNLAINAVFNPDKPTPTAIFSLEMSTGQLINRMLSSITKIPLEWLQNGSLSEGKMIQLQRDGYDRLNEAPIYIDDTAGMTMFELRSKCRRMKSKHGIGLVIIDYLQLMDGEDKRGNREQEISKISRSLKGMAKDLEIPVIALSQMSRDVEKRGGTPRLSDLRECLAVNSSLIYSDDGLFHNSQMAMRLLSLSKEGRTGITDSFNIPKTYNTVYRLKTRTGRYVDCTENHPILTSSGYKRLKDITMEDAVAVALNWENSNGEYIPEAKFIGWMIGNGCMCGYNVPSFITRDKEISDRFVSFIENRFSFTPKIHRHNISKVYQWDMTESSVRTKEGNPVTNWLKEHNLWGEKAYGKKIPDWFLRAANAQSITELIQGLWETDGCVVFGNRKYLKYSTISFELANQILYLLAGLGIVANLSDGYLSNNANYPIYEVIIDYDEGIKIFKNKIALDGYKGKRLSKLKRFRQSYINNRLNRDTTLEIKDYNETSFRVQTHDGRRLTKRSFEKIYADSSDQFKKSYKDLVSKDVFWDCVRSVKEVGILPVFDRCVPGTNNFVVNGIVVHNSGAIEQDADIVGFIYRPSDDDVKKDPDLAGVGNFKIAKHRNGALDDIILAVDLAIQKWMDMSEARQYEDSKHPYDQKPYPLYRDPSEPKSLDDDSPF